MATINVTRTSQVIPGPSQSSAPRSTVKREPIEAVLIKLGEILTQDELHVSRINMKEVAKACQKHRRQIQKVAFGYCFSARTMEEQAMYFFEKHYVIATDKVKIEPTIVSRESERRNDLPYELQLSFHKFDAANDSHLLQ